MSGDTLKFLVATDNHLGAYEKNVIRRDDSFVTFEEILQKAVENKVDFVLLCGDLFDENKPGHATLHRTMGLLRKYCMGNKNIEFELVSDPGNMSNGGFPVANFQDPNMNVAIPIFAIHGNHDDPVGEFGLSALDLLSASGLLNYFGKTANTDDISISPLLIKKGETKLALYGLGHVRDERLHRCFLHKKVRFLRPTEEADSWFNLFAIHQNRNTKGVGKKNGVNEEMLKGFLDLVIWGHEHEQVMTTTPARNDAGYDILQPGSSIQSTPNSEDLNPKKICLIEVHKTSYRVTPLVLKSTRPYEYASVVLADEKSLEKTPEDVSEYLTETANDLIRKAQAKIKQIPDQFLQANKNLKIPIVRIRVDYSPDFPVVNSVLFGGRFINTVANPHHMLVQQVRHKKSEGGKAAASKPVHGELISREPMVNNPATMAESITNSIREIIQQKPLGMLSEYHLTEAVFSFIDKSEANAVNNMISDYMLRSQKGIWKDVKSKTDVSMEYLRKLAGKIKENVDNEWQVKNKAEAAPTDGKTTTPIKEEPVDDHDMPEAPAQILPIFNTPEDGEIELSGDVIAPLPPVPPPKKASKKPAAKKAAKKPPKKPAKKRRIDDDEEESEPEQSAKASPLPGLAKKQQKKKKESSEDDESEEKPMPPPKKKAKKEPVKVEPQKPSSLASVMANWGKKK
eukprot:TRINITY_DN3626_c0_g1_i1.p1 TRINITY_DN3626_c0_g1~~TRINITY_DN3626_c0_g1_i1.p1  ORF type:complete len:683 (+),score=157.79 TRINITY_DN3626_c0_g1_i1:44-2092(+)